VAGRDITEGRGDKLGPSPSEPSLGKSIAFDVGVLSNASIWQNTDIAYDVALGGMPFIYAISDAKPYIRQTAPYRKEQFDNQTEPGEHHLLVFFFVASLPFMRGLALLFMTLRLSQVRAHLALQKAKV
jgi:hypothetical protein